MRYPPANGPVIAVLRADQSDREIRAALGQASKVVRMVVKIEDHLRGAAHRGDHVGRAAQNGLADGDSVAEMPLQCRHEFQVFPPPGILVGEIDPGKIRVFKPSLFGPDRFLADLDAAPQHCFKPRERRDRGQAPDHVVLDAVPESHDPFVIVQELLGVEIVRGERHLATEPLHGPVALQGKPPAHGESNEGAPNRCAVPEPTVAVDLACDG